MKNKPLRLDLSGDQVLHLYDLSMRYPEDPDARMLRQILDGKIARMQARDAYTRSKTAATPEARETARQAYLEARGIPQNWRW